jgi:hypothetical protein
MPKANPVTNKLANAMSVAAYDGRMLLLAARVIAAGI